jgi:selenocysteine-specific elongation factor
MQVIATAGHVDHGKSALVRALTGMEPDRWAEERRRGLTIDLGFAWMKLPGGECLAFVDVPGHERFVPNMLAGVGPVPAVLIVVAADGGWMPQSAEHLAAIDAMGIRHGLLVVTRCDLADPEPASRQGLAEIAASSLGRVESVATSSVTGAGLPELRDALARLVAALPPPDAAAPVRLWVDRSFSIRGSGTVVTGTLPAGTVRTGQELLLTPSMRPARIRRIESMNEPAASVTGVARVALNLRGLPADVPARGMALVDADRWTMTRLADVRLSLPAELGQAAELRLPPEMALHIGSARTAARIRLLGAAGPAHAIVRLMLREPLPLHVGDRVLLRDPGSAGVTILGAAVLDVAPPALARRGAAAAAGRELAAWPEVPAVADLLRRHGLLRASAVAAMGTAGGPPPVAAGWLADPARWSELRRELAEVVAAHARRDPLAIGMTPEAARAALRLPDRALVEALARPPAEPGVPARVRPPAEPGVPARVRLSGGYLVISAEPDAQLQPHQAQPSGETRKTQEPQVLLPASVLAGVRAVLADLAGAPFLAPEAGRLRELGLDARAIGAAARAGLLLRVSEQIVLAPGAETEAARALAGLPQPFTTAEARQALGTTRRVAIPLLEYLDRAGITQRLPDDRRRLRLASGTRLQAVEFGRAAQRVRHPAGGAQGVGHAEQQETAAVDPEHRGARRIGDRDVRVHQGALADRDALPIGGRHLVAAAQPAAEHGDDLSRRDVLARHPHLRHDVQITGGRLLPVRPTATRPYRGAGDPQRPADPARWPAGWPDAPGSRPGTRPGSRRR